VGKCHILEVNVFDRPTCANGSPDRGNANLKNKNENDLLLGKARDFALLVN
jgi:hypothetical protein